MTPGLKRILAGIILVFAIVAILAAILAIENWPVLEGHPEPCGGNLNSIGKALLLYMKANDERIPPDVDALIDKQLITKYSLRCPDAKAHRERDYFIHWPGSPDASRETLLACDYRGNHKGERHVLFYGGQVSRRTEQEFQQELEQEHNAAFAAALRQAEATMGP